MGQMLSSSARAQSSGRQTGGEDDRKGDREAAIKRYEKALELNPNNAGARRQLEKLTSPTR